MYEVYALYNRTADKIYVGQTNNLERRLSEHNQKRHSFTGKFKGEWKLIFQESATTRSEALRREKQLKSAKGREFVKSHIPE